MCKGRAFALREMLIYTSVLISLYDVEPVGGGRWPTPKTVKAAASKHPAKPVRVWIKRREVAAETKRQ